MRRGCHPPTRSRRQRPRRRGARAVDVTVPALLLRERLTVSFPLLPLRLHLRELVAEPARAGLDWDPSDLVQVAHQLADAVRRVCQVLRVGRRRERHSCAEVPISQIAVALGDREKERALLAPEESLVRALLHAAECRDTRGKQVARRTKVAGTAGCLATQNDRSHSGLPGRSERQVAPRDVLI